MKKFSVLMFICAQFSFSAVFAGAISALTPADRLTLSQRFPANPVLITHSVGLENYIASSDPKCTEQARSLLSLMDDYSQAFHAGDRDATEGKYSKMAQMLKATANPCHVTLSRAYLLGSFLISMDSTNVQGRGDIEHMRAFAYSYVLLTYNLFKNDELVILDHPIDVDDGQGKRQRLIGAYDCKKTLISVDIGRRPFDLASLYSHELSHLLRDKFIRMDYFYSKFSDTEEGWHSYILLDESVAVANQIERQRIEQRVLPIGSQPEMSFRAITGMQDDTTFINWDGPVGKFLQTHQLLNWLVSEFYYKNAARDQPEDEGAAAATMEILNVVNNMYFPASRWAGTRPTLEIELGRSFDPWPERIFDRNYYLADQLGTVSQDYYSLIYSEDKRGVLPLGHVELSKLEFALREIETMPSPLCTLYLSAVERGLLRSYIGTRAGGVHPGGEGSKGCLELIDRL